MPVNNMPARTFDHKYSAPRSARSSGELAFKLARDDDKENGAAKGQALSPSKIIKGVRGRAVGTPTSHSVEWPHAVRGHSAGAFSSSSGPASSELANSLDSLAGISNIQVLLLFCKCFHFLITGAQDMSPDFLEALVALREEVPREIPMNIIALLHVASLPGARSTLAAWPQLKDSTMEAAPLSAPTTLLVQRMKSRIR